MGQLSILGAQRVKALIEMLHDKKRQELLPYRYNVSRERVYEEIVQDVPDFHEHLEIIVGCLGDSANRLTGGLYEKHSARLSRKDREKMDDIEQKYKRLERELWLCETLEEARAIVDNAFGGTE